MLLQRKIIFVSAADIRQEVEEAGFAFAAKPFSIRKLCIWQSNNCVCGRIRPGRQGEGWQLKLETLFVTLNEKAWLEEE